jgi:hypothetical protein
LEVVRDSRPSA